MSSKCFVSVIFCAALLSNTATAQSPCLKCRQDAHLDAVKCAGTLPPVVTPKDKKKPTEAEKAAMKKRSEAESSCNKRAQEWLTKCRPLCPAG